MSAVSNSNVRFAVLLTAAKGREPKFASKLLSRWRLGSAPPFDCAQDKLRAGLRAEGAAWPNARKFGDTPHSHVADYISSETLAELRDITARPSPTTLLPYTGGNFVRRT